VSTPNSPLPDSPWPTAPPGTPGLKVGFPGAHELASPARRFSHRATIIFLAIGLGVLTALLIVVAILATPGPAPYCSPLKCQGPPVLQPGKKLSSQQSAAGPPVVSGTPWTSPTGYSLRYVPEPQVTTSSDGIGLTYDFTATGPAYLDVFGGSAAGTSPQSLVQQFVATNFPSAAPVYQIPDPLIGYHPAFGEAFNVQPASSDGSTGTSRALVAAATYNGFGIVVVAYGGLLPTVNTSSQYFNDHPSPANLYLAYFYGADSLMDSIVFPS